MKIRLVLFFACITAASCFALPEEFYWVMAKPCPDDGVRVWVPAELPDHKDCDREPVSPALALAIVLNIINDAEHHQAHYHISMPDRGFVVREFLSVPESKTGERAADSIYHVHYHGMYVDLDTSKRLIRVLKAHQHGAE